MHPPPMTSDAALNWSGLEGISDSEKQVRTDLAACYRLAARKGWDDGIYTHISACIPGEPGAYLINRFGLLFSQITPQNLVKVDVHGQILSGQGPVNRSGFAIHGAVHAARADANCVLHLHVDEVIAVSACKAGLLPLSQHALRFYQDIAYHPYQGLALSASEQSDLIQTLGGKSTLLLANHGSLVCGATVQQAFYLMDVLVKSCKIQVQAAAGAPLVLPDPAVCQATYDLLIADGVAEGQLEWPGYLALLS